MILRAIFVAAGLAASSASLGACTHAARDSSDPALTRSLQQDDAYREAARRCGSSGIRQTEGSSGANPSDYVCQGH